MGRESVFESHFQAPKTQRALRTIPFGPRAVNALSEHRARVTRRGEDDLVFGDSKAAPLRESRCARRCSNRRQRGRAWGG
jgi:hypothetical protein